MIEDYFDINKHGIKGVDWGNIFIPEICLYCDNYEYETWNDGFSSAYYCLNRLIFPTKKGTCKRRK